MGFDDLGERGPGRRIYHDAHVFTVPEAVTHVRQGRMSQRDRASSPGAYVLIIFRSATPAGKNQPHLAIKRNVTSSVMTFRSMTR